MRARIVERVQPAADVEYGHLDTVDRDDARAAGDDVGERGDGDERFR
jgi:hypothetical protein